MSLLGSLFGDSQKPTALSTPLELVTYVTGLASNQDAIGPMLDTIRSITARLQPGQSPSPEDDERLMDVYFEVESYLIAKEPLRSFTSEVLRKRASPELLARIQSRQTQPPAQKPI